MQHADSVFRFQYILGVRIYLYLFLFSPYIYLLLKADIQSSSPYLIVFRIGSNGEIVQFILPFVWKDKAMSLFWILYIVIFFVAFALLLLNLFLAVIVDNFGGKRNAR